MNIAITDKEFSQFQRFIHEAAGINLSPAKKALVSGRLARRLQLPRDVVGVHDLGAARREQRRDGRLPRADAPGQAHQQHLGTSCRAVGRPP